MNRALPIVLIAVASLLLASTRPADAALDAAWRALPASARGDSIALVLHGWELRGGPNVRPGEAAYALAQFRYARGEYAAAEAAFGRASARLDGVGRAAARYGFALAALAQGHPTAARVAFEDVARGPAPTRAPAQLGVAQCWEAEGHPEKAFDTLRALLAGDPGESGPCALERYAALATRFHRDAEAVAARARLAREYPRSLEAARLAGAAAAPSTAPRRGERLETGATPTRLPAP